MQPTPPATIALALALAAIAGCGSAAPPDRAPLPGWTTFHDARHRLTVRFPSTWHRARPSLTPHLVAPREILSIGSYPLPASHPSDCAHMPARAVAAGGSSDVFLSLQEAGRPSADPSFAPRRRPFVLGPPRNLECVGPSATRRAHWTLFSDAGRRFYLLAVIGRRAPAPRVRELRRVLDELRFDAGSGAKAPR